MLEACLQPLCRISAACSIALTRNFHFVFPVTDQYTPLASARDPFCLGYKAKDPVVRDMAFAGTKKP
jgi:hypothetical protein